VFDVLEEANRHTGVQNSSLVTTHYSAFTYSRQYSLFVSTQSVFQTTRCQNKKDNICLSSN